MVFSGFTISRTVVDLNLKDYIDVLQTSVNAISNADELLAEDVKFICHEIPDEGSLEAMSFEELATYGIGILDIFLFHHMSQKENLKPYCTWVKIKEDYKYQARYYPKAIMVAYFLLMCRAKIDFTAEEPIPKFLESYCSVKLSKEDIKFHLGRNDFTKVEHKWIRDMASKEFSEALCQRLMGGVAGTRMFTAILHNPVDRGVLPENIERVVTIVKDIALSGPYWTQHPFFYPTNLKGISILKNLSNLMTEIYTPKTLQSLVASRTVFKLPKYDDRHIAYKSWGQENFRNLFKEEDKMILKREGLPSAPAVDSNARVRRETS